jgi:FKBP-type peptidyl-prolyl cis-trans isomerase FklB
MKNNHKSPLGLIMLVLGSVMLAGCQQPENDMSESTFDASSDVESASYLQEQGGDIIDMQAYGQGARDAIAGQESQVPVENEEQLMGALTDALMQQKAASSESFMQENAARAEVTTTDSGLQYEVLVEGTGPKPAATDTVVTHYHGTLTDGTVFDSSVERGSPATFPVNRVIAGWTEALQMMGTGSKWRLVIPSELAYGERGAGGAIPPNATLVFEVELLEIQ